MNDPAAPEAALTDRLAEILAALDSALRREGVQLFVDHVLATKLRDAIDLHAVHALVLRALTRDNIARIVARHVQPGWRRSSASIGSAPDSVGDLLPEDAQKVLHTFVQGPSGTRAKWLRGAVDPTLLRRLLAPVWVQLLVNFAKRLPIPGMGSTPNTAPAGAAAAKSGIASFIGRGVQQQAERLVDAGRSALEGLGIDVEKRLLAAARDFSEGALAVWNQALRERLRSDEGRAIVAQLKQGVLAHLLRTPLKDLRDDLAALPVEPLIDLAPAVLSHAVTRPLVRAVIDGELQAFLQAEGERSLADLLGELGALDEVRTLAANRADASFGVWAKTPEFANWLARLHQAARS